jgi:dipeptidyl aminopeptidase/acylaminoacyl peptidase
MRTRLLPASIAVLLAFTLSFAAAPDAAKRAISEKDLWQFNWIGDPQMSPDGARVAFAKVVVDKKHTGYETSIWAVSTKGGEAPQRLTSGTRDSQPRWSPDGKMLAFARAAEKEGKPQPPQIFLLSMSGGEPVQLTDLPKGAGGPEWSPDGKRIAFSSDTNPEDLAKQKKKGKTEEKKSEQPPAEADKAQSTAETKPQAPQSQQTPAPESKSEQGKTTPESAATKPAAKEETGEDEERETDVKYVTRAVYRFNGQGYTDPKRPSHIWVVDVPTNSDEKPTPKQLTSGKFDEDEYVWSRDGREIIYITTRVEEPYYELPHTDIYSVLADGGEPKLINALKIGVGEISLSPDGKMLAFHSNPNEPVRSYDQPDLYIIDLAANAQPKNLTTDFDNDVGAGIGGDNAPPRAGGRTAPIWAADGQSIIDVVTVTGRANLMRFPMSGGKPVELTKGDHAIQRFESGDNAKSIVLLISTPTNIGDLFVSDTNDGEPRRLTNINEKLFSQLNLTEPEEVWYTSFDGKKIQAWVQKPPDFDKSKKYPLILNIHGGPHSAYGWVFDHEFQWMAAKGYVVLYPNPRGSTSYGQEFGNIIQYKYPGDDYKDLMAGVDELIKRGYIDEHKLGVTGGSGGGVLTNWTVTQTNRFQAAVSQRDISNWADWWYTDDFWLYQPRWFRKPPFQDPKEYADRSSITFVDRIHTPMAFVLGDADWRTPPGAGGEQLFRALKFMKRPTAMVRFPGESHELSRSGQPWHRIERLQAIVGWFDKYLLGKDVEIYRDVAEQQVPAPEPAAKTPPKKKR